MTSTTVVAPTTTTITTEDTSSPLLPETMAATAALFTSTNTTTAFDTRNLRDPLKLNLKKQVKALLSSVAAHPEVEIRLSDVLDVLKSFVDVESTDKGRILNALSRLLSVPELVETVVELFRPLLIDLFARWLDGGKDEDEEMKEERLVALVYVIEVYEEIFPILHEFLIKFYPRGPLHFVNAQPSQISAETTRLHCLLLTYFRIQQANRELPSQLFWSLSPLSKLTWSPEHNQNNNGVKLLAIWCYALQSGMGEAEREKLERKVLGMRDGEVCSVDCWVSSGGYVKKDEEGKDKIFDGWVLPMLELKRIKRIREGLSDVELDEFYRFEAGEEAICIQDLDLSPRVASVHGILLLRQSEASAPPAALIPTPTSIAALRALALHISMRVPTLLTSSPSAGKALLLNHLAGILYPEMRNQVITIHLADTSLDPRSLLGSYISSPTNPGNFEWKEGVLVRAMREGRWVVFEDIDRGSSEVLGVIKPLIESLRLGNWIGARAKLDVPSWGCVVAHQDFLVFATRSIQPSRNGRFAHPVFFGAHKFCEMIVDAPQGEELKMIVERRYGKLEGRAAEGLIDLWEGVKSLGAAAGVRDVGLRELEKLCARVERLLSTSFQPMDVEAPEGGIIPLWDVFTNPSLREEMYLEARDVFFGAGATTTSAKAHLNAVAAVIGEKLGLDEERRDWLLKGRTPGLDIEKDVNGNIVCVSVGRTRLAAKQRRSLVDLSPTRPFAMHRPAVCLLSRIMTSTVLSEPVLLTGETGTGKTSVITHLATLLGRSLTSLNLSHQTESSDLIGGLKPVDTRVPASALQERFLELFGTTFSRKKNEKFETEVRKGMNEGRWKRVVGLWRESGRLARERLTGKKTGDTSEANYDRDEPDAPRKRRRVDPVGSSAAWDAFLRDVDTFEVQHLQGKGKFAFGFVEGPLVKALRSGDWILLDEINLASPETLECISGLLHGPTASITLTEQGSLEPVPRHPDFRLFACMNPATDVGKKDLPPNIRSRFTEIDVPPPDADKDTLLSIINQYIGACAAGDKGIIMNVAEFYIAVKDLAEKRQLADGANHRPHFSMRTLARALTFAADMASMYSLRRSVWEGCLMAFTMVLDPPSAGIVTGLMHKHLLVGVRNPKSMLRMEAAVPRGREEFIKFGPFYLEKGTYPEDPMEEYIMTPSVETKLVDLARIITTRRFPVLIEGPTSSGKTSSVEYLARRTGHRFVRINNHEHTDIQEYLGSYVSDPLTGKLVFKDGLLVHALRNGDWIVLDELNLAPTDVLEALNRLLDDNRELVIPETQEVVRPHPHFMLFATQNPPGLYAGRKVLSRAFRNRFLEVHFQDVPQAELESILCQRCRIAPSYGKRIVTVFRELQKRRQAGRVFESKQGFATLRDLFRWANRDAVGYQELADNGYMLLAERARREDDKAVVREVIQSIMGVQINEDALYNLHQPGMNMAEFLGAPLPSTSNIVWTKAMQRLYILVCRALRFNEPVLLVGETGSGKTSVCQVFADVTGQRLHGLNCHQNTETADIIGALRPIRNRTTLEAEVFQGAASALAAVGVQSVDPSFENLAASLSKALKFPSTTEDHIRLSEAQERLLRLQSIFEWHDGPLIEAMRSGDIFLLDEISLADDSVLERLNSVLEPGRTIVLAEKGGSDFIHPTVKAASAFKLVATMNPGGDYGKKELSPALRNRFTEIWVPRVDNRDDLELIVDSSWKHADLKPYTRTVLDYIEWLSTRIGDKSITSLRDIIAWVMFSNAVYRPESVDSMSVVEIYHHAAQMTYLDGLGSLPQLSTYSREALARLKGEAMSKLHETVPLTDPDSHGPVFDPLQYIQLGSFAVKKGPQEQQHQIFNLKAPTSRNNAMRVLRACQLPKPILLEGSPGVGKTSLITALADISGHHLCRINLSDQTDLVDLFGSDLPIEGGAPGEFAWRDAEFLKALQHGHWVLLDEMNLAPQAVLEGLNAVLDHRGTVYIPELDRSFTCHPSFRIFAAQNPLNQGGGRKGLPKSFVNRFTKVYIDELTSADLILVCQHMFPDMDETVLRAMISFNTHLSDEVTTQKLFGRQGTPWEFNLRDVIRWGCLLTAADHEQTPVTFLRSIYLQRFRADSDRHRAQGIFDKIFVTTSPLFQQIPSPLFSPSHLQIGHFSTSRDNYSASSYSGRLLKAQLSTLETLGDCITQGWLAIITGPRDSGKSHVIRNLADSTGHPLREVSINSATDTMDIIGSFEQVDTRTQVVGVVRDVLSFIDQILRNTERTQDLHGLLPLRDSLHLTLSGTVTQDTVAPLLHQTSSFFADISAQPFALSQDILKRIETLTRSSSSTGRFEWVDGPLVQAMRRGEWLVLDGANLCNPSVLDRLNSLCEPNGQLTLNERGLVRDAVEVIRPHPGFRLFMTVDPQYGELSRAMRNRGIEIFLPAGLLPDDYLVLLEQMRLPQFKTSVEHSSLLSLKYLSLRRGLAQPHSLRTNIIASSGRRLDQFSALSSTMDRFPLYLTSSNDIDLDATTFFLSRTFHPAYIPYFRRILDTCDDMNGELKQYLHALVNLLSSPPSSPIINRMKDALVQVRKCPAEILYRQAMDGIVNEWSKSLDGSSASAIMHILDFITAMFLQNRNRGIEGRQPVSTAQSFEKIRQGIDNFLNQLSHLNEHLFALLSADTSGTDVLRILPSVLILNRCGRYLHNVSVRTHLDHSAIQVLARMINDALKDAPMHTEIQSLTSHARRLHELSSLSSGTGLIAMWSKWNCSDALVTRHSWNTQPDDLVCSLDSPAVQLDLRRQVLRLVSITRLTENSPQHEAQVIDIISVLRKQRNEDAENHVAVKLVPSALVLGALSRPLKHDTLERFLDIVCSIPREPLSCYVTLQQLSWTLEAGEEPSAKYMQSLSAWLESLFDPSYTDGFRVNDLLQPSQLDGAVALSDLDRFTLLSMTAYERDIDLYMDITLADVYVLRVHLLESLLCGVSSAIDKCVHPDDGTHQTFLAQSQGDFMAFFDALLLGAGPDSSSQILRRHLELLRPLPYHTTEQRLSRIGYTSVALGTALLELLVPDTPVDPVAIQNTTAMIQQNQHDRISSEIHLHQLLERITTGNDDNFILAALRRQLRNIIDDMPDVITGTSRDDVVQLHAYWAEVWQFRNQVISESRIFGLLHSFTSPNDNATLREQVVQESITGFHQRLDSVYPAFSDLNMLLKMATSLLRLGVRCVSRASMINTRAAMTITKLIRYPSISGILGDLHNDKHSGLTVFDSVYLDLVQLTLQAAVETKPGSLLASLERSYDQVLGLWLIDKAKEAESEIASQSLYRGSVTEHNAMTDAELEQQEFLALFPSFENSLDEDTRIPTVRGRSSKNVSDDNVARIARLHLNLYSSPNTVQEGLNRVDKLRKRLLPEVMKSHIHELPSSLDTVALVHRLRFAHGARADAHTPVESAASYNFYQDPNLPELRNSRRIVVALRRYLKELFIEWPEQMVLQHLMDRCDTILGLSLNCPVAKVLSALEQLLLQTDDWEMYANRENSLSSHRQSLTELIVRWRRLELSCWNGLLDSEAQAFAERASEWWFRLYDAIIRGFLDASKRKEEDPYLTKLIPLIDEFVASSPLGQFAYRIQLLQSFELYVSDLSSTKSGSEALSLHQVVCVIHSTLQYYRLHQYNLQSYLTEQRTVLDKEIKNFIKLASWKDINVQALKQSAQKTHHQLYKVIHKFREILREPIIPRLTIPSSVSTEVHPLSLIPQQLIDGHRLPFSGSVAISATGPLSDLAATFKKFDAVYSNITSFIHRREKNHVDGLAIDIIVTSKELSEVPVPSDLSPERRTKFLKSLLVRKRKAFSDLLKELKRHGFVANVKPDILRRNCDTLWLRGQPVLDGITTKSETEKIEIYFSKILCLFPELRSSLSDHHSDLQTRELQRALSFLESGFSMATDLRARLAMGSKGFIRLRNICSRLHGLSAVDVELLQMDLFDQVRDITHLTCRLAAALTEVVHDLNIFREMQKRDVKGTPIHEAEGYLERCAALKVSLLQIHDAVQTTPLPALRKDEHETVLAGFEFLNLCLSSLGQWSLAYPHLQYLFEPTREWLSTEMVTNVQLKPSHEEHSGGSAEALLNTLLYTVQVMVTEKAKADADAPVDGDEDGDQQVLKVYREIRNFTQLLSLDRVLGQLDTLLASISTLKELKHAVQYIIPFLDVYRDLAYNQLAVHTQWTKAILKLDHVLCSTILRLAKEGFCQPPETEEQGDGDGEALEAADGTGLGEGSGTENISKEIEDESQVEGLKDENEGNQEQSKDNRDDNAVEMSEDFGGTLEDVPGDESQEEGDKSDGESESDPEERIDDLDSTDPSALDEKIWGDESGPQDSEDTEDKTGKDHSEEQSGSSEVVAKESNENSKKEKGKENKESNAMEEDGPPEVEEQGEEEEGEPNATGAPMEDFVQDANTLDLPDEMDLDAGEEEKEINMDESEIEGEGEEEEEYPDEKMMEDKELENNTTFEDERPGDMEHDTTQEDAVDDHMEPDDKTEARADKEEFEPDATEDQGVTEEVTARPDTSAGDDDVNLNDEIQAQGQEATPSGQAGSSKATQGEKRQSQDKVNEQTESHNDAQEQPSDPTSDDGQGNAMSGIQEGQNQSSAEQRTQANPLRNLGDTLKEIKQHFDEILNSETTDQHKQSVGPSEVPPQLEYAQQDEEDQDMQALGPAGEEQVAKLDDLKFAEDNTQHDPSFAMDIDETMHPEHHERPTETHISKSEQDSSSLSENVEGAVLPGTGRQLQQPATLPDPSLPQADAEVKDEVNDGDVEAELRQWQAADFPDSHAEHMWRLYESMTHDLAYVLCEQLRLILEPTLATRLKGDFRTGKRLNMKKIIPYIASDYTKDKIWLRRTKPSQREYQVLIAIDDSRSMAESHSIHLAYQTLALISKALSRLEAGDIAIAKFGGSVDILHGFDQGPFTDQAGTQIVNAFTFKQKSTNVLSLVDISLKLLERARERRSMSSASAADLWQLEIIISDGICQDHDKLRTVLRKAEEQKVMIVFLILDSLHPNIAPGPSSTKDANIGSILTMTKPEFKNVDGKIEMQLQKYLDSFPFEYYVVLRDVEALPDVLAGTLKQFFERVSEE
ncbi:midasin [Macrolepiota fuliginosa MF-IS2]|uniref:Midasin n=1 Tax=Macrolepiota fuliginosa MF-IS2 TaxID=1400762 RepID=A0A9P5XSB2_9AGAR|nr:midasin [Macrolepiota fuliginosa MF-IS2]